MSNAFYSAYMLVITHIISGKHRKLFLDNHVILLTKPATLTTSSERGPYMTASGSSLKKMTPDPPLREALKGSSKFQNPEATWPGRPRKGRALGRRLSYRLFIPVNSEIPVA